MSENSATIEPALSSQKRRHKEIIKSNKDETNDYKMTGNMPELQDGSALIVTTGSNQEGQQQGGVDHRDVFGRERGGLKKRGTNEAARGRTNKHKKGSGNKNVEMKVKTMVDTTSHH